MSRKGDSPECELRWQLWEREAAKQLSFTYIKEATGPVGRNEQEGR